MVGVTVEGQQHHPVGSHDFPNHDGPLICRLCSYSSDGLPLRPVSWPCPAAANSQQAPLIGRSGAQRLARAVTARRAVLGWTQPRLASAAGVSVDAVRRVERAHTVRPAAATLGGLDRGLRWLPGTARRILDHGDAPPDGDALPPVEQQVIARAGLPAGVEAELLAHMAERRQVMEAALEQEAHMLVALLARGLRTSPDGEVDGDA
jgi:transcriptional regulator with XRE-family HTH domain